MTGDVGDWASVISAGVALLSMILGYRRMGSHSKQLLAEARDARRRDFEQMRREARSELNVALMDMTSSSASPVAELHKMSKALRGRVACYADSEVRKCFHGVLGALMQSRADDTEAARATLTEALARLEVAVEDSQTSIEVEGRTGVSSE